MNKIVIYIIIVLVLCVGWYFLFVRNYDTKEILSWYKNDVNNNYEEYSEAIRLIDSLDVPLTSYFIRCMQNMPDKNCLKYEEPDGYLWRPPADKPPIFFAKFMKKREYGFPRIRVYNKTNILFSSAKFSLRSKQVIVLFYQKTDNPDTIRKFFGNSNLYIIDDSDFDELNRGWIYRIRQNWYIVGL